VLLLSDIVAGGMFTSSEPDVLEQEVDISGRNSELLVGWSILLAELTKVEPFS
jgi:hypothetical protein